MGRGILESCLDSPVYHQFWRRGKLSYELLNKDLIQFAHRSKKVQEMIADKKSAKSERNYIII